ncbi:MAG: fumarylacetoacetate hydrolase family protein [Rubrivivax sp.]
MNPNPFAEVADLTIPTAPWRLSGTVVGALLNHAADWEALGAAADAPPYKGRAKAPVLHVRPRNTLAGSGAMVAVPAGVEALEVGATLGLVIGRTACRVGASDALGCIAGYVLAADLRVPHGGPQEHYRPAVRHRARDGFCPIGPRVVPAADVPAPDAVVIDVAVDGAVAQRAGTGNRLRGAAALLADVSAFMTLHPGDVLLLGNAPGAPLVRAGSEVALSLPGIGAAAGASSGTLRFKLVAEEAAA